MTSYFSFKHWQSRWSTSLATFTGLFNAFLSVWIFIHFPFLMPTVLLICMENTFWNINGNHDNFVDLFKESFKLYVESGTRMKVEAPINILRNERGHAGGRLLISSEEFKAKFYTLITEHLLRKFYCFFVLYCDTSNHFLHPKYSPSCFGTRVRKKVTWLQRSCTVEAKNQ